MDWLVGRNGILTKAVESVPGGALFTAPFWDFWQSSRGSLGVKIKWQDVHRSV